MTTDASGFFHIVQKGDSWANQGTRLTINRSGNVGIGTITPSAALQINSITPGLAAVKVKGAPSQTANLLEFRSSDDTLRSYVNPSGALFFNPAMDQVASALTIAPNFNGAYYAGAEHNAFTINGANMAFYGLYTNPTVRMFLIKDVNGYNAFEVNKIGMATLRGDMSNRSWVTNIHVDSGNAYYAGNADGLLINGTGLANHGLYSGGTVRMLRVVGTGEALAVTRDNRTGFGTLTPTARVEIMGSGSTSASVGLSVKNSAASSLLHVRDDGNVGIGTSNPASKLEVAGMIHSSSLGFKFPDGSVQTTAASGGGGGSVSSVFGRTGAVTAATGDYTWAQINKTTSSLADLTTRSASDLSSGTVPTARLGSGTANTTTFLRGDNTWAAPSGAVPTVFGRSGAVVAATNDYTWAQINKTTSSLADLSTRSASDLSTGTVAPARLGSGTANNTTFLRGDNSWTAITSSQWTTNGTSINYAPAGNVGIATANPTEKLHVTGNGKITGNLTVDGSINAKYQDLAEWVPSSEQLSAGTVVVLDTTKSNQVVSSGTAYDTRVAGVISAQPGITLGEGGEGKVLVATTGRVRVKVDASRGAIQIGDLLVTSDVSGVAMKSEPVEFAGRKMHMPGTIIGKALEPLAKGKGEILVLLSLQ